jgi:hypothetical protein
MNALSLDPFPGEIMSPNMFFKHDRNPSLSPSKIPVPIPAPISPSSPPKQPNYLLRKKRPPSPEFLTKDTTIKSFNVSIGGEWDQDEREQNLESLFETFVSRISQQGQESSGLKEALEVYKSRGRRSLGWARIVLIGFGYS